MSLSLESYSTIEKENKFESYKDPKCTLDRLVYTDCNWETCKLETYTDYTLMGFSCGKLPFIFKVSIDDEDSINLIHMSDRKENYYSLYYGNKLNRMLRFSSYMKYNCAKYHPLDLRSFYRVALSDFKENGIYMLYIRGG